MENGEIMIRNIFLTILVLVITAVIIRWQLQHEHGTDGHGHDDAGGHGHGEVEEDYARGPHNGRLLEDGEFALEVTIFETGVPPEFRIFPYSNGNAVDPAEVELEIVLGRTGNVSDQFTFYKQGDFLRGEGVVTEPHSFNVTVNAIYQGSRYEWYYESYEGRTMIPEDLASEAGISTEIAGPATIRETMILTGRVEIDPNRVSRVMPRFPGIVKSINAQINDVVSAGDTLLIVESSESLQDYPVKAPINGLVTLRNVQPGEVTANEPLYTIVDLSQVWVQLDIFPRDMGKINIGQQVSIQTLDGRSIPGKIERLSPMSNLASQTIHAIIPIDNTGQVFRPGQFITAEVDIAEHQVPLAVKRSGVQQFRDFDVVYGKFGDTYEVRMLEFGLTNDEWMEVLGGLAPGTEYVTENSYLIKADIEKSGASHDH